MPLRQQHRRNFLMRDNLLTLNEVAWMTNGPFRRLHYQVLALFHVTGPRETKPSDSSNPSRSTIVLDTTSISPGPPGSIPDPKEQISPCESMGRSRTIRSRTGYCLVPEITGKIEEGQQRKPHGNDASTHCRQLKIFKCDPRCIQ